ncbi:MAG: hypothetical protein VKS61_16630 [Candidatus Sericytochromatia bacterium]|nr:hypothetical protein [Candidatus Sericytochromatia bacterium]
MADELTLTVRQGGSLAWLGDGAATATVAGDGSVSWHPASDAGGGVTFALAPDGPAVAKRAHVGETAVLQTTWAVGSSQVAVTDFLPVRLGAAGDVVHPRRSHQRLVRLVEATTGPVRLRFRLAANPGGRPAELVEDPNGLLLIGRGAAVVLQTTGEVVLRADGEVEGVFELARGQRRAFLLTWHDDEDPEVPEAAATVPDWELDGTYDYWLAWARRCPFQGAQRQALVALAAMTKAAGLGSPGGEARLLGAAALAAWGFEDELPACLTAGDALHDLAASAWLLDALAEGYVTGLLPPFGWLPHAEALVAVADALAERLGNQASGAGPSSAACLAGLWGATRLVEEGLLAAEAGPWRAAIRRQTAAVAGPGGAWGAGWQEALGLPPELAPVPAGGLEVPLDLDGTVEPLARLWRVRRALTGGAWLQARRGLDALLQEPLEGLPPVAWSHALWLGARIHLQEPPPPGRATLGDDLGFD